MVAIYESIKHFPLVFVSLVSNTAPLLTAILSYWLFGVGLSLLDSGVLIVSFAGVAILITGDSKSDTPGSDNPEDKPSMILPTILLILIPFLSASVTLFIRHLKSLSEITIGSLMTFAILLIYGPLVYFTSGFAIFEGFTLLDWVLGLALGITSSVV